MSRFVRWLTGEETNGQPQAPPSAPVVMRDARDPALPAVDNDAAAYGVQVEPVQVPPGARYWRVKRVHHLTPEENQGRHHIYIEATTREGRRVHGQRARITWEGGEHILLLDKPQTEPAGNFPMWKQQICTVEMLGMPSDRVHGLSTDHPDEPLANGGQSGNTRFHHSFLIEFQQVSAPEQSTRGAIQGRVVNGRDGMIALLQQQGQTLAQAPVAADGAFLFEDVEEGLYRILVDDLSQDAPVSPGETTEVTFLFEPRQSTLEGTVHNGGGMRLRLLRDGEVMAEGRLGQSGAFRLRHLGPGAYILQVLRDRGSQARLQAGPFQLDGHNSQRVELALEDASEVEEVADSPFEWYVLFGRPDSGVTQAQLAALAPVLADKRLTFGFDFREAAYAKHVLVIGGASAAPKGNLTYLASRGVEVHSLTGTPQQIAEQVKKLL